MEIASSKGSLGLGAALHEFDPSALPGRVDDMGPGKTLPGISLIVTNTLPSPEDAG